MRIAYVTQNINRGDGQGRVCYELAKEALRQGHEVSLLTNFAEPDLISGGARWIPLHPRRWRAALCTVREFTWMADRALAQTGSQMDIIHGFGYSLSRPHHINSAQFVHRAWRSSPAHPARTSWRPYALYHRLYSFWNIRWEQVAFAQARVIVACSQMVKDELIETGIAAGRIRVIGNGVHSNEFAGTPTARAAVGLPDGVPLFLFAGDIRTPRKNLGSVLRALRQIPEAHLAVVGASARSPFPRMAERLGIGSRVHFMGFRNDLPVIMGAVDGFVFPAYYEPFGMVVLEAMASALPVITAATTGVSSLVSGDSGFVIDHPDNLEALVAAMRRVMESPDERKIMGAAARAIAQCHSWLRVTHAYLDLYKEITEQKEDVAG